MCEIVPSKYGGDLYHAIFDAPQWAPTPGQYLVLYAGDVCVGGGVITAASSADASSAPQIEAAV